TYTASGLSPATTYYFQVRATNAAGDSTPSNSASAMTRAASLGLFSASTDVGSPGRAGSANYDAAAQSYTVRGGGVDIWDTSDQFQLLARSQAGDATIVARVASLQNTDSWAKAGVMFRDGTGADAPFAMVVVTPGNGVAFQWRSSRG